MKVDVLDRLDAIGETAWGDLHRGSRFRSPFLTLAWQREWLRAFADHARLEVRAVRSPAGRLVAVLPLYEVEPGLMRLVGGVDVSDYLDLLVLEGHEEEAWLALLQARGGSTAVWELHAVPASSPSLTLLPGLAETCGLSATAVVEERCPVLALPESWDAYLASLPSRHRHEMQRKVRRLRREVPDVRVECARTPDEIAARFPEFLDLHRRSRTGKARFMDERMERFFRQAIGTLAAADAARLWLLDTEGGPIASFVCLEWDGSVGLYNSGFHPDRAALAPGLVLLTHLIEDAIVRGKRRFDFLRGEERYKYEFGPSPEEVFAVRIERPRPTERK